MESKARHTSMTIYLAKRISPKETRKKLYLISRS